MSKEIEHEYTQEIVCPHCGSEWLDSWEVGNAGDEDLGRFQCDDCGEYFYATRDIDVTYVTEKCRKGTCRKCGKEDVLIQDYHAYSFAKIRVDDYCDDCLEDAQKEWRKKNDVIDLKEER